jgi:pheromone shutdown-related protein TraB
MKYKNLVLLGTSHIAKQSLKEVESAIKRQKPDILALELDRKRLASLMAKKRPKLRISDIGRIGIKGFLFNLIGAWAEKKLGQKTGVPPGSEMKKAFEIAREKGIKVALIDQDIEVTLRKISKRLTWREKWNFLVDLFKAVVLRKKEIVFDLRKVPSSRIIKKMTKEVKIRYPNVYKVLVEERNLIMARRLFSIFSNNQEKKVLAIIGAGHEEEIISLIKGMEPIEEGKISYSFTMG